MGLRRDKGLYDPRNEHDACGVGFVANIKGRKSHDIIRARPADPRQSRPSRRGRRRPADGRRRRLPDPDAGRAAARLGRAARHRIAGARPLCRRDVLSADGRDRRARSPWRMSSGSCAPRGRALLAWRDVPTDTTGLGARVIETMPWIAQAIVAASPDIPDQDAFERKILTIRKQILNTRRAARRRRGMPAMRDLYMPSFSTRTVVYKGLLAGAAGRELLRGSAQPADRVGAGAGASAVLDQHLPVVAARRTPTGSSATTARSTRCAATSTGCTRAARRCRRSCSAPISTRWCR